ncbi:Ldh family oxidoreductase [Streptomyces sp. NPDC007074]|uniref:Ldh family oxidoreductase n=1 Tax=Streptomyces sp. NPDC007074 TaxID=3156764 RepID=UPI0033D571D3
MGRIPRIEKSFSRAEGGKGRAAVPKGCLTPPGPKLSRPAAPPPVLGVNPLSFALPTLGEPLSADMSTTLAPMGVLWEHRRTDQPLPEQCFVDTDGHTTRDGSGARSGDI